LFGLLPAFLCKPLLFLRVAAQLFGASLLLFCALCLPVKFQSQRAH
jgi:hypothetical protein